MTPRIAVNTTPSPYNSAADTVPASEAPLSSTQQRVTDNLTQLLEVLPDRIHTSITRHEHLEDLLDIHASSLEAGSYVPAAHGHRRPPSRLKASSDSRTPLDERHQTER